MQVNIETLRTTRNFGDKYSSFKTETETEISFDL